MKLPKTFPGPRLQHRGGSVTFFRLQALDGTVRVEIEETVEGVGPDQALAWWTDYREGPHDHGFLLEADRHVVEEPEAAMIEDRVEWLGLPVFSERVRAQQRGNTVKLLGENTWATFRATYTFEHTFEPEGTEVRLVADVEGRGPLAWVQSAARPIVEGILRRDTRRHLDEMRADLAEAPGVGDETRA